jgi:signal transduction histidine kinase
MAIMNEKLRVVGGLTRHDVRNKLAVITSDIYLFKKKLADRLDIIDNLNDMQLTCDQIVRIFEFARDYERLGMEELTFVDVGAMVDKAASSFSDKKGTRVVNDCHGVTVLADSFLERLFYNLIDNSLKYGGKLTQIRIHHEQSGDGMRLIYEDNGTGISKEARTKLFTEGFTTGKGTGYGLYLIKRMVEVYGWIIEETGERGKGARFVITIPRQTLLGKKATE